MLILLSPFLFTTLGAIPDLAPCLVVILWGYTAPHDPRTNHRTQPDNKTQDTTSHSLQLDGHRSPDNGASSIILCCLNTHGFPFHKFLFDCHVQHKYVLFWSDLSGRGGGGGNDQTQDNDIFPFKNHKGRLKVHKGRLKYAIDEEIPYKREIQNNLYPPSLQNINKYSIRAVFMFRPCSILSRTSCNKNLLFLITSIHEPPSDTRLTIFSHDHVIQVDPFPRICTDIEGTLWLMWQWSNWNVIQRIHSKIFPSPSCSISNFQICTLISTQASVICTDRKYLHDIKYYTYFT